MSDRSRHESASRSPLAEAIVAASPVRRDGAIAMNVATRSAARSHHVASTDGTPIAVWRSGDGPPLVLVHGAAADHTRWAPVLPALERQFTVLAIDRRGRGGSGDADATRSSASSRTSPRSSTRPASPGGVIGHLTPASARSRPLCSPNRIRRLVLHEPRSASWSPTAVRRAAPGAARRRRPRRAAGGLPLRGRRLAPRTDRPASLAARLGPPGAPPPLRSRARNAPTASTLRRKSASARSRSRRCCSAVATAPRLQAANERCARSSPTRASPSCPGSDTPRWTPAPHLFLAEALPFLHATATPRKRPARWLDDDHRCSRSHRRARRAPVRGHARRARALLRLPRRRARPLPRARRARAAHRGELADRAGSRRATPSSGSSSRPSPACSRSTTAVRRTTRAATAGARPRARARSMPDDAGARRAVRAHARRYRRRAAAGRRGLPHRRRRPVRRLRRRVPPRPGPHQPARVHARAPHRLARRDARRPRPPRARAAPARRRHRLRPRLLHARHRSRVPDARSTASTPTPPRSPTHAPRRRSRPRRPRPLPAADAAELATDRTT